MARGRPIKTELREKLAALLSQAGCAYGYELYKMYKEIFEPVSLRNIYYNLKKGLSTGEFIIIESKREPGEFTWGSESEHIYYGLGPYAITFNTTEKQKQKLVNLSQKTAPIDWLKETQNKIKELDYDIANFHAKKAHMKYEDVRKLNELLKLHGARLKDWASSNIDKEKHRELSTQINELIKKLG